MLSKIYDHTNLLQKRKSKGKSNTTANKRKAVYKRDGDRCLRCGTYENLTLDHIKAKSRGGSNDIYNLQTLCVRCNFLKGAIEKDYRGNTEYVTDNTIV